MTCKSFIPIALLCSLPLLAGCAPLIGAGAIVAADEIAERERGGQGLF